MTFNTAKKKVKKSAHLGNRPFIGHRWALTVVVGVGLEACGVMVMEVVMTRRKWPSGNMAVVPCRHYCYTMSINHHY